MISLAISIFVIVCMWLIYEKLGLDGWKCLIPFYNAYVLCKRIYKTSAFFVCLIASFLMCIGTVWMAMAAVGGLFRPLNIDEFIGGITVANILIPVIIVTACMIVLIVYQIIIYVKLGNVFGKSGAFTVGLVLLTPIFLGILAIDSRIQAVDVSDGPDENEVPVQAEAAEEEIVNENPGIAVPTERVPGEGNKICPYCRAEIAGDLKKCPYCRSELD